MGGITVGEDGIMAQMLKYGGVSDIMDAQDMSGNMGEGHHEIGQRPSLSQSVKGRVIILKECVS